MAKTFGQYTGGIQAIQGINEFGAQQAAGIQRLGEQLAGTITKTYDTLNQQEEENSANKELIKGQSGNLAAIKKLMDANPDTKDSPLSQSINEMIAKLDSAGDLTRGQLKGLLKSSEVFTSQLPLTMQLQDKAFLAQTTAGVQKALAALKNQTVKDSKGYDIPVPSFAGGSPEKYQKDLQTFFEQHKKDNPEVQLDVGKAVRDSVQLQIQRFTNDPDLTKADPTYKQHLIRGFEALSKRDAEIPTVGGWFNDTKEEDVFKAMDEVAAADRLAGQAPADIRRGELAADALEAQRKAGNLPPVAGAPQFDANGLDAKGFDRQGNRPITAEKRYENATKYLTEKTVKAETTFSDLKKEDVALNKRIADMRLKEGKDMSDAEFKKAVARREEIKGLLPAAEQEIKDSKADEKSHSENKAKFLETWFTPTTRAEDEKLAATQLTAEGKFNQLVATKTDRYEKRYLEELLADVKKGGYVGFGDRLAQMALGNSRLSDEISRDREIQAAGWGGVGRSATVSGMSLAETRRNELVDWIRDLRTKQDLGVFEGRGDVKPAQKLAVMKLLEERIGSIDKRLANPVAVKEVTPAEASAKAAGIIAGAEAPAAEAPKPDIYAMGFDYKMTIPGVFVNERPLTYEEEKDGIRQWFEKNHNGVVPTTIDSIYKTIRPEAALKFAKGPNGENLMHTDKGWTQMTQLTAPKGMTSEEKSDEGLYNFGQIVNGRRIPIEARTGSGIMVSGFFSGGKKRAEEFNQALTDTATLVESVPELVDMFKKTGHSIKLLNQEEQGRALSLLVKIRAAIRVETIGTGPIAIAEHKMLMDRLGDPNALFTLDKHEISKLQSILDTSKSQLQRTGVGVNITYRPAYKAGANPVQQNKLDNRINQGSK